jgi:hypothetical protein
MEHEQQHFDCAWLGLVPQIALSHVGQCAVAVALVSCNDM